MLRTGTSCLILASCMMGNPATATIIGVEPNASFATTAYTINLGSGDSYIFSAFSYDPNDPLYRVAALATTGTATAYGGGFIGNGTDYTSYSAGSPIPANNFGGDFIDAPTARPIDYSLADTYVALRFGSGNDVHFGYAEVAGTTLVRFAYNDVAGASITTGDPIGALMPSAVPEPTTWAMLIAGFGVIGGSLRRRQRGNVRVSFA